MINRPTLFSTPNLANKGEFTPSDIPGASVDTCYAFDSAIRGDYDGSDTAEWDSGKQVQETLPAAQWDAMQHDQGAFNWQLTVLLNSIYDELYSFINGQQIGMDHDVLDAFNTYVFNKRSIAQVTYGTTTFTEITDLLTAGKTVKCGNFTLTSSTGSPASKYFFTCPKTQFTMGQITVDNTDTWATDSDITLIDTAASQTLTNKTIVFDDNTLTNVCSLNTAQTLTNKSIDRAANTFTCSPTYGPDDSSSIPVTKEMHLVLGSASTQAPYSIGNGPYAGFELRITVTNNANAPFEVNFLSGGVTVTKYLSVGVHHLTWQDSTGWTFVELSGTYTDNTTFTYLL